MPVYAFWLPLYSFWHFDDFSWGNTRRLDIEKVGEVSSQPEQEFSPSMVQLKSWAS